MGSRWGLRSPCSTARPLEQNFYGFFDLSNIPMAAVERIEILPVGASAVYGADSLGGAVNIILLKNINGFEANATLDHANGVNNPGVNVVWGKTWERSSVSLVANLPGAGRTVGGAACALVVDEPAIKPFRVGGVDARKL